MALIDNCIFWNKLGANAEVDTSEIGVNGVRTGVVTYTAAKFDKGVDDPVGLNTVRFPLGSTSNQAGIGDFWFKPAWASTDNVNNHDIIWIATPAGYAERIVLWWSSALVGIQAYTWEGVFKTRYLFQPTFSANQLMHVMYLWDSSAGAGDRLRMWFDTVELDQSVISDDGAWAFSAAIDILLIKITGASNGPKCIVDNLKLYDSVGITAEVLANRNNEGFPTAISRTKKVRIYAIPAFTPPAPTPKLFAPIRPKVLVIGDVDIYAKGLVDNIGNITESRSFRKDKMTDNEIRIPVDNKALDFSPSNPKSFFNGTDWYFSQVKIWDEDNIKIWDGKLWDIIRNSKSRGGFLVSRSIISKIKNIKVAYESADYETGPDALMNIFAAADPPITEFNQRTFQEGAAILTAAGALLKLKITAEDNTSMQNIIAKVAEYCAADAYGHLGEIYFKVWKKITASGSIPITEEDILKQPITQSAMSEIINTYSIGYSGDKGTPATDEDNNNIGLVSRRLYGTRSLPELSTGDENQIVFPTLASAVWIGEQYVKRTHRNIDTTPLPLIMSSLSVDGRLRNFIDLEAILGVTYSDEGFSNETMEPFKFVRNNDKKIVDLILYTVAS